MPQSLIRNHKLILILLVKCCNNSSFSIGELKINLSFQLGSNLSNLSNTIAELELFISEIVFVSIVWKWDFKFEGIEGKKSFFEKFPLLPF